MHIQKIKQLTDDEIDALKALIKSNEMHRIRHRAHMVLLMNDGYTINQLAKIFWVDRDTVSFWITNWEKEGIAGLYEEYRSGRNKIYDQEEEDKVIAKIAENPRQLKKVKFEIEKETGKASSLDTIKRIAKKSGLIWKRVKKIPLKKPDKEEYKNKKELINKMILEEDAGLINLYFFDDGEFSLTSNIPYAWQEKGAYIEIPTIRSSSINVLAFLSRKNQLESFTVESKVDSDIVISVFNEFSKKIKKSTYVIIYNAPIHTAKKFTEAAKEWIKKGLHVFNLPKYSPQLNKIEILLRFIKYLWLPFSSYRSIKDLKNNLNEILSNYGNKYLINYT